MTILIGTSGWQYRDWRGRFYPEKLAQREWLEFYSRRYQTVEVNNTFYRLPEERTFVQWRQRTPSDFVVGVKVSRYLTHIKRLKDPEDSVKMFMDRAGRLSPKLGPLLIQLPPTLQKDLGLLREALDAFPKKLRLAVEFRHQSWFVDEVAGVLADANAAYVLADRDSKQLGPAWRTADWSYLRFHAGTAAPRPCYSKTVLARWVELLASKWQSDADIYVFFNNDPLCCAVRDSVVFARLTEAAGLEPTRVPEASEVKTG